MIKLPLFIRLGQVFCFFGQVASFGYLSIDLAACFSHKIWQPSSHVQKQTDRGERANDPTTTGGSDLCKRAGQGKHQNKHCAYRQKTLASLQNTAAYQKIMFRLMLAHSLPIDPPIRITCIQTHLRRFQRSTTLSVDKVIQQTARYLTETLSELTYFGLLIFILLKTNYSR